MSDYIKRAMSFEEGCRSPYYSLLSDLNNLKQLQPEQLAVMSLILDKSIEVDTDVLKHYFITVVRAQALMPKDSCIISRQVLVLLAIQAGLYADNKC